MPLTLHQTLCLRASSGPNHIHTHTSSHFHSIITASHDNLQLTGLALIGSFISFAYSVPWIKLKRSGWIGNYALGSSYIALPWWAGQV